MIKAITRKSFVSKISVQKLKHNVPYFLFLSLCFFTTNIFAQCASGDQLCSAYTTFNENFGPSSTIVYIILGTGALGAVIHCLATHNYKVLITVVVCFLFITAIYAII